MDSEKLTPSLQHNESGPGGSEVISQSASPSPVETAFFAANRSSNSSSPDSNKLTNDSDLSVPPLLEIPPLAFPANIELEKESSPPVALTAPMATLVVPESGSLPELVSQESNGKDNRILTLEERVVRLEKELSRLKDTKTIETRVAAKVQEKLAQDLGSLTGAPTSASLVEISKRLLGMNSQSNSPRMISPRPEGAKNGWLVFELLAEVRAILRMVVDPRYKMSWVGRVLPVILLFAFVFPDWVISIGLPGLGSLLLKISVFGFDYFLKILVQLLIGFVLFKVLNLEVRRYRQASPDLPSSLRL